MFRYLIFIITFFGLNIVSQENDILTLQQELALEELNLQDSLVSETETIEIEDSLERNDAVDSEVFGYDFFNYESKTTTPFLDLPLQGDYRISLNDEVEILLTGVERKLIKSRVDLSGSLMIPQFGMISLSGLSLNTAQQKVNELISQTSPGTKAFISITNPSARKISVIGMVQQPGTYQVNPYTTVSEAIKYSQGLSNQASLRAVEVIDFNGTKSEIDLYSFLVSGDRSQDRSLNNGDSILVKSTTNFVRVTGDVLNVGIYEYLPSDKYKDLIKFAQGYKKFAEKNYLYINFIENGLIQTKKVDLNEKIGNTELESVFIPSYTIKDKKNVRVAGQGVTTGFFDPDKYKSLYELYKELAFSSESYPFIFLFKKNNLAKNETITYGINPKDTQTMKSIKLNFNDELEFYSIEQIIQFNEINNDLNADSVFDEDVEQLFEKNIFNFFQSFALNVKSSDSENLILPIGPNFNLSDVLNYLDKIQLSSSESLISVVDVNSGVIKDVDESIYVSKPQDIVININPLQNTKIEVSISGMVVYPGEYLVDASTNLSDLYKIAGGFRDRAFYDGIVFTRNSIADQDRLTTSLSRNNILEEIISSYSSSNNNSQPIDPGLIELFSDVSNFQYSGRLSGNFSPESESVNNIYLQDGDSIFVPVLSNTVRITGQVNQPITTSFKDLVGISEYIDLAGGFSKSADKKLIFVISANGEGRVVQSGFFRSNPVYLRPGDTIFVPRKINSMDNISLARVALEIFSSLAISAASLNALNN